MIFGHATEAGDFYIANSKDQCGSPPQRASSFRGYPPAGSFSA
jgi:hypothetical protein